MYFWWLIISGLIVKNFDIVIVATLIPMMPPPLTSASDCYGGGINTNDFVKCSIGRFTTVKQELQRISVTFGLIVHIFAADDAFCIDLF